MADDADLPTHLTSVQMALSVKAELERRGMTQAEFARLVGQTEKHVCQVLGGKAVGKMATLDYWAFTLGCRWSVFLVNAAHPGRSTDA